MSRSVEEWTAVLQRYIGDLEKLKRDKLNPLDVRIGKFNEAWPRVRRYLNEIRQGYTTVRRKQRQAERQLERMRVQIHALLKALQLGKALMATDEDVEALERAIKLRKNRLKVQKHRAKKKLEHEVWPNPGELHL